MSIIPKSIHAYKLTFGSKYQYTPEDSMVIGGNFLHSYNIEARKSILANGNTVRI